MQSILLTNKKLIVLNIYIWLTFIILVLEKKLNVYKLRYGYRNESSSQVTFHFVTMRFSGKEVKEKMHSRGSEREWG